MRSLRQWHEAELVDDQKLVGGELALQAQQPLLVAGLDQLVHDRGGVGEADRQALLASGKTKPQSDMALAGAGVADRDDVLAALDVLRARQLHHQRLVQVRERREVEAVDALHGWELRGFDAAIDHASLTLDDLGLDEPQQIAGIVDAFGGALVGDLVVLAQDRRQLQRFEVMGQQDPRDVARGQALGGVGHDAAPTRRSM